MQLQLVLFMSIFMNHIIIANCRTKSNQKSNNYLPDLSIQTQPTYIGKLDCSWTGCQINGITLEENQTKVGYLLDFCVALQSLEDPKSGFYRLDNRYIFCDFTESQQSQM